MSFTISITVELEELKVFLNNGCPSEVSLNDESPTIIPPLVSDGDVIIEGV